MSLQSAQSFQAFMESKDMKIQFLDDEEKVAKVGFNLDGTTLQILIFFGEDNRDVHFEGRDFITIPADKREMIYHLCNQCNSNFRWVTFVWNEEHECMTVQADAIIEPSSCAEECYDIIMRMCGIVQEAYPIFMKAIWT